MELAYNLTLFHGRLYVPNITLSVLQSWAAFRQAFRELQTRSGYTYIFVA